VSYLRTLRCKDILLALSILIETPSIHRHLSELSGLGMDIAYCSRLALLWGAIIAAAYIRPPLLRWMTALIFSASAYFATVFDDATTQFMTYDAFINMTNAAGSFSDALAQNLHAFISAIVPALLLFLAMGLAPAQRKAFLPTWASAGAPWLAAIGFTFMLFVRGGDGGDGLPASYTPIAYVALAGYEASTGEIGARQPVQLNRIGRPRSRNIVFIIDESIAGQYLGINSERGVDTPLSRPWPGVDIYNYGLAISVSNCSSSSNVTLRYGGTRSDYRHIIATQPSIWAYAHKAGMRTIYIDAQTSAGALQNFMTKTERAEIDQVIQLGDLPLQQRDMAAADLIISAISDPRPKFILVNKSGAHFPIQDRYPDQFLRYRPALARHVIDSDNTGKQLGFTGSPPEWRVYRNSYRNTLLWNVGSFFDKILRNSRLTDTTLIYTSDHGQNLHEDGSSGIYTHCDPAPVPEEGVVPLVVVEGRHASGIDWHRDLASNHDRSSHFMIFPTLLKLMGYDAKASERFYGRALDDPSIDPGTFNILFNARLNRQPTWVKVEHAQIRQPPLSDGA